MNCDIQATRFYEDKGVDSLIRPHSVGKRLMLTLVTTAGIGLSAFSQAGFSLAAQQEDLAASIVSGTCDSAGAEVAVLNPASVPGGPPVGADSALPGANSFSTIAIGIDALLAADHAVAVTDAGGNTVTCGEIGGRVTGSGSLIVGLHQDTASDLGGVVVFSPDAAGQTNVSLFVVGTPLGNGVEAAAATNSDDSLGTPDSMTGMDLRKAKQLQRPGQPRLCSQRRRRCRLVLRKPIPRQSARRLSNKNLL